MTQDPSKASERRAGWWTTQARRRPVLTFYVLAFAISWAGYASQLARAHDLAAFRSQGWLACLILPATGPALAAWITSSLMEAAGTAGSRLRKSIAAPVSWRWWLTAALLPGCLLLAADGLSRWLLPGQPHPIPPATSLGILLTAGMSFAANPWEEVGWRGFALTQLQTRYSAVRAALIVGMAAALWHIPLFLRAASPMSQLPFLTWSAGTVAKSLILAWLFNNTSRNLLVVTLFHITLNIVGALLGVRSPFIDSAITVAFASILLLLLGPTLTSSRQVSGSRSELVS